MLGRLLRLLGLARRADMERERLAARASARALRERVAGERQRAAAQLAETSSQLHSTRELLTRQVKELRSDAASTRAAHRERLRAVRQRVDKLDGQLSDKALTVRMHKMEAAEAREQLPRQLAQRTHSGNGFEPPVHANQREAQFAAASSAYAEAKARWAAGERPPGTRYVSISGLACFVPGDAATPGSLSHRILERGWLPWEDIAATRQLVVGGIMLDIGANIGTTSIPRVVLGDFDRVYCAEPDTHNYACLVGNIVDNGLAGRVLPDRVAISSAVGTAQLRRGTQIGGHMLVPEAKAGLRTEEVECFTLDAWLDRIGVHPAHVSFVKVDTQGWDLHVLAGAHRLRQERRVVWQVEVSPSMMRAAGSSVEDLCNLVTAHFTHVKGLAERPAVAVAAAYTGELIASLLARRRVANLLLFNLDAPQAAAAHDTLPAEAGSHT